MNRIEWMAVGWGGTVAGLGLIVISTGGGVARLIALVVLCLIAGFLAGVRAEDRRVLHAVLSALAGCLFWVVFVAVTWVADLVGGPKGADWELGGDSPAVNLVLAFVAVVVGGAVAAHRLRPQGGARRKRSDKRR